MPAPRVFPSLTNRKNSNNAVDGNAHDTFSLFWIPLAVDQLDSNIDSSLLTKPHDLRARSPVPAHQSLVCSRGDKIFRGQCNSADAIQMPGKLLQGIECQG